MEKFLKEIYRGAVSNIPANSGEAFGNFVIKISKAIIWAVVNFLKGLKALKNDFKDKKAKCKKLLIFLALALIVFVSLAVAVKINQITIYAIYVAAFISSLIPGIYIIRIGAKSKVVKVDYSKQLQRVGLFEGISQVKDKKGNYKNVKATPHVITVKKINNFTTFTFRTNIILDEWLKAKDKIKSVFNSDVLSIRYAEKSYNRIIVEMAEIGSDKLPQNIPWKDEYYKKGKVTLGMGAGNKIIRLDITKSNTVHTLIAGLPGAGKSVLSKKFLNDCCLNGYYVEIIDRKGGLDYMGYERAGVKVATTLDNTLIMTRNAAKELDARLKLFRKVDACTLEEYNKVAEKKLARYVIFVDEASEVFSSETEKKKVAVIKENVTSIVRRGRALGMNVILTTQKCSAIVITTEIRSLLGTRICGYVSTASDSKQILDHGYAAGLPKISGRFTQKVSDEKFEDFQVFKLDKNETIIYIPKGTLAILHPTELIQEEDDIEEGNSMDDKLIKVIQQPRFDKD